ncbi:MAG TPA: hypothetical protein VHB25_15845 [Gemmatimonadaceae bacterium]|nr:hypothetical protein [Gemmatimonadaceae bacterium]
MSPRSVANNNPGSLPQQPLVAFDGIPAPRARAVERWLEHLAELPLAEWLAASRAMAGCDHHGVRGARTRVNDEIDDRQLALTAWCIRDHVATCAHAQTLAARAARRAVRREFAVARGAAEWAALAIALEEWIPSDDHELLCRPFARSIARAALHVV